MRYRPPWLALALALNACGDDGPPDTCDVPNDALSIVAVAFDNGEKVRAELDIEGGDRTGPPDPLRVCSEDRLTIEGRETTVTIKPDRVVYSLALPIDTPRAVAFTLERSAGDPIALTIQLPPPLAIVAPADAALAPRSEDLVLRWDPPLPEGEVRINVEEDVGYGLCVVTMPGEHDYKTRAGVAVPDTGQWTIPAGVIASMTPTPCSAFYSVRRLVRTPYPQTLAPGGFLEGRVRRTVEIVSVP